MLSVLTALAALVGMETRARAEAPVTAKGIAVLAIGAARAEAATLARSLYATKLRPPSLDELHARTLIGDAPAADAPEDVRDVAQIRAAIAGDDAASRSLLSTLAERLHVEAIVVVRQSSPGPQGASIDEAAGTAPQARLYLAADGALDSALYVFDPIVGWAPTVRSLEARFLPKAPPHASLALADAPTLKPESPRASKPFYASTWFWGAIAGSAFLGSVVYFASQTPSDDTVRVRLELPR